MQTQQTSDETTPVPAKTAPEPSPEEAAKRKATVFRTADGGVRDPMVVMVRLTFNRPLDGVRMVEGQQNKAEQDARYAKEAQVLGLDPKAYGETRVDSGVRVFQKKMVSTEFLNASLIAQGMVPVRCHQRARNGRNGRKVYVVTIEYMAAGDDVRKIDLPGKLYGRLAYGIWDQANAFANPVVSGEGDDLVIVGRKDTINLTGGRSSNDVSARFEVEATTGENDDDDFTYICNRV